MEAIPLWKQHINDLQIGGTTHSCPRCGAPTFLKNEVSDFPQVQYTCGCFTDHFKIHVRPNTETDPNIPRTT